MPSAAEGSTTRPAWSANRIPAMIGIASRTRHGVVGDKEEVVQDGRDGMPPRDAVSDGVGRNQSAVTTRRLRHECVIAGAPGGRTQTTSTSGASAFTT